MRVLDFAALAACLLGVGCSGIDIIEEERILTVEHYLVPCSVCGIACSEQLCLQTSDAGKLGDTYPGIQGYTFSWGTRSFVKLLIKTPAEPIPDGGGPEVELLEVLGTEVQPAGTRFALELVARYFAPGTESDLQLVSPGYYGSQGQPKTERHLRCDSQAVCAPILDALDKDDDSIKLDVTFEHPASPAAPLDVVAPN